MKKLRWAMDSGFWEVDISTPLTVDGVARPVPSPEALLPLGLSRGTRLSRPKQIDFFQRFMAAPFVPLFSNGGLSFQRVASLCPPCDSWFPSLLGQFKVQEFVSSLRRNGLSTWTDPSSLHSIWKQLLDRKFYTLGLCSEWWLTPEDTLLLSLEAEGDDNIPRKKAVFQHKFPLHNLTVEASSPALFVDHLGNYWNVPFTMVMDIASVASDAGTSCHLCINRNMGSPKQCEGQPMSPVPSNLLTYLCAKCAISFKKKFDIWRSEAPKTKMVQPYDIFLSNPHVSASALLGTVVNGSFGNSRASEDQPCVFQVKRTNSAILADLFASVSLFGQHGNFQKHFLDLTRACIRLDIPSGSKFLFGLSQVAYDLSKSQVPSVDTFQAICPSASISFQQQIAGPFSFRVDAALTLDPKKGWHVNVDDPICAIEYALQVLGSAKAVAWYSVRQREFMVELRFFET